MNFKFQPLILALWALLLVAALVAEAQDAEPEQTHAPLPVIDLEATGFEPLRLPAAGPLNPEKATTHTALDMFGAGSDPANPFAVIRKHGTPTAAPGQTVHYAIEVANFDTLTHTFRLAETLPPGLDYLPAAGGDLVYDPAERTLSWAGTLAPGGLDYVIEAAADPLPYLDLADFGAPNLCAELAAAGEGCDDGAVTFNLGKNGLTTNLYGAVVSQLTVSANGLVTASSAEALFDQNRWLPDEAMPGFVLAGLWRDADLGEPEAPTGRFHAAIVRGLFDGVDVFYAQWHNAAHVEDPNLTARHAIALPLASEDGSRDASILAGHLFYVYDNLSDPAALVARGYTIGVADNLGLRGATYAFAPCCGDARSPQGYPPAAGTTLHLRPVLFGTGKAYRRIFTYAAVARAPVPETVTTTAVVTSSAPDPAQAHAWSTHYLHMRHPLYLPLVPGTGDAAP